MHFHGLFPLDKLLEIGFLGQKFYTFLRFKVGPLHPSERVHHSPQWWRNGSFPCIYHCWAFLVQFFQFFIEHLLFCKHCWKWLEQVLFSLCSIFSDFIYTTLRIWFQCGPFISLLACQRDGQPGKWSRAGDRASVSGTVKSPFFCPSPRNVPVLTPLTYCSCVLCVLLCSSNLSLLPKCVTFRERVSTQTLTLVDESW